MRHGWLIYLIHLCIDLVDCVMCRTIQYIYRYLGVIGTPIWLCASFIDRGLYGHSSGNAKQLIFFKNDKISISSSSLFRLGCYLRIGRNPNVAGIQSLIMIGSLHPLT